jgi:hypothetical protein
MYLEILALKTQSREDGAIFKLCYADSESSGSQGANAVEYGGGGYVCFRETIELPSPELPVYFYVPAEKYPAFGMDGALGSDGICHAFGYLRPE